MEKVDFNSDLADIIAIVGKAGVVTELTEWEQDAIKNYKEQANKRFYNDNKECAKFLINLMIGTAKKDVKIYSGGFSEEYYQHAIKNTKATVVVLVDDNSNISWTKNYDNVTCHTISQNNTEEESNHFFLVDGKAFRYETNKKVGTAIANFNEEDTVKKGIKRFNKMLSNALPVLST
jgi:hypothetical protein